MNRRLFFQQTLGNFLLGIIPTFAAKRKLRFGVASDGHYGQDKTDFKQYFDDIVKHFNNEKGLDFVVFNGDLFHDDIKFLPEVKAHFDKLKMPYFVTRGNHDHVTPELWKNTWGYDLNSVVDMNRFAILLLDTSNEKGEYLCPDVAWLDAELAKLTKKKAVFLFLHIPSKQWTQHGTECADFHVVLKKYPNVKAMFHGHDHSIDTQKADTIPAIFDGHFGGNWGTKYRGYRIVDVNPKGDWATYQFNPEIGEKVLS